MTAHIQHSVLFDDGSTQYTLEPPNWTELSAEWTPVAISSIFEAYDGGATKQINAGASQKWKLSLTVKGCKAPSLHTLDQSVTWDITLIDRDDPAASDTYTMWCEGPPQQTITGGYERSWVINFREQ